LRLGLTEIKQLSFNSQAQKQGTRLLHKSQPRIALISRKIA
jgi:hypothetical protein